MAAGAWAVSLLLFSLLILGERAFCKDACGINGFGESVDDLLEAARHVSSLLEVTHPRSGPHRSRRSVGTADVAAAHTSLSHALRNASLPERLHFTEFSDKHTPLSCRSCYIIAFNLIKRFRESDDRDDVVNIVTNLCVRLNVSAPHLCQNLVEMNVDLVGYVLKTSPKIDTVKVCSHILRECDDGKPELKWPLKEPLGERPPIKPRPFITNLRVTSKPKPIRILHVTDFHYDSTYEVGGNAECGLPTCCRNDQGNASAPAARAGRWGDYRRCDIPWETVEEFCKHFAETQTVDIVYFTGDIVDHGVWETSREGNLRMIRKAVQLLRETFGNKTKVFPIVGNHEPHPVNQFVPGEAHISDELGTKWLYEALADEWSFWLPEDTRETIKKGGFYQVRINNNLRIIALNTMFCYNLNWWMMLDPVDPAGQLSWLVKNLKEAEAAGEKVHILSHMPPGGGDCLATWSEHFWNIVKRFSDTIVGQFNGHTHWDEMRIFYTDDGRGSAWPFNAALNGASLTTYSNFNPVYKIYHVDGRGKDASWQVRDAEVWGFNLTDANSRLFERPHWFKSHTFTEIYNIPSMHVSHLDTLVRRFASDKEARFLYWKLGSREADSRLSRGCDDDCLRPTLCNVVTTETRNLKYCHLFFDNLVA